MLRSAFIAATIGLGVGAWGGHLATAARVEACSADARARLLAAQQREAQCAANERAIAEAAARQRQRIEQADRALERSRQAMQRTAQRAQHWQDQAKPASAEGGVERTCTTALARVRADLTRAQDE